MVRIGDIMELTEFIERLGLDETTTRSKATRNKRAINNEAFHLHRCLTCGQNFQEKPHLFYHLKQNKSHMKSCKVIKEQWQRAKEEYRMDRTTGEEKVIALANITCLDKEIELDDEEVED